MIYRGRGRGAVPFMAVVVSAAESPQCGENSVQPRLGGRVAAASVQLPRRNRFSVDDRHLHLAIDLQTLQILAIAAGRRVTTARTHAYTVRPITAVISDRGGNVEKVRVGRWRRLPLVFSASRRPSRRATICRPVPVRRRRRLGRPRCGWPAGSAPFSPPGARRRRGRLRPPTDEWRAASLAIATGPRPRPRPLSRSRICPTMAAAACPAAAADGEKRENLHSTVLAARWRRLGCSHILSYIWELRTAALRRQAIRASASACTCTCTYPEEVILASGQHRLENSRHARPHDLAFRPSPMVLAHSLDASQQTFDPAVICGNGGRRNRVLKAL